MKYHKPHPVRRSSSSASASPRDVAAERGGIDPPHPWKSPHAAPAPGAYATRPSRESGALHGERLKSLLPPRSHLRGNAISVKNNARYS